MTDQSKDGEVVLVCARANSPYSIPGTTIEHTCSQCGEHVQVAPSGQVFLAKELNAAIVCKDCLLAVQPEIVEVRLADKTKVIAAELRKAKRRESQ